MARLRAQEATPARFGLLHHHPFGRSAGISELFAVEFLLGRTELVFIVKLEIQRLVSIIVWPHGGALVCRAPSYDIHPPPRLQRPVTPGWRHTPPSTFAFVCRVLLA